MMDLSMNQTIERVVLKRWKSKAQIGAIRLLSTGKHLCGREQFLERRIQQFPMQIDASMISGTGKVGDCMSSCDLNERLETNSAQSSQGVCALPFRHQDVDVT